MTRPLTILVGLAALLPIRLGAQVPIQEPSLMKHPDSIEELLFPPELVMQRQRDLKLTPQQRSAITDAVKVLQSGVVDHQWQMQDEQQKLHEMLAQPTVDEAAVLAQVDRVLELERGIKKAHLLMLIRVKNTLTVDQQEQLRTSTGPHLELKQHFNEPT